jgi:hypothetical protein
VDIAGYQIATTQHPSVRVLINDAEVATLQLGLSFVFRVTAMGAKISAGRLVAMHSGRCDLTAPLSRRPDVLD